MAAATRLRDLPQDHFWHHWPADYHRDPEEQLEHLGYDPEPTQPTGPPARWEP